jgi:hypothetical protein
MSTVETTPEGLVRILKRAEKEIPKAVKQGLVKSASLARAELAHLSTDFIDLGVFAGSWKSGESPEGAQVYNNTPYAAVLEIGARPHTVDEANRQHIYEWVLRHMNGMAHTVRRVGDTTIGPKVGTDEVAKRITNAICKHIQERGIKGHYVVRDNMHTFVDVTAWVLSSYLTKMFRELAG